MTLFTLEKKWYPLITVTLLDIILIILIYLIAIYFGKRIKEKRIKEKNYYKHFFPALLLKITFAIIFCIIYMTAYTGDANDYFEGIVAMTNLFWQDPMKFFKILINPKFEYLYFFTPQTGFPHYHMYVDYDTFIVTRIYSPLGIITHKSFLLTTILVSLISFSGIWKLYVTFVTRFPAIQDKLAFAILYFPSVLFWGSAILKETLLLTCLGWLLFSLDKFIFFKRTIKSAIIIFITGWIITIIRPFVLIVLLPTVLIWIFYEKVKQLKQAILRYFLFPFAMLAALFIFSFVFSRLKGVLGEYGDVKSILEKAKITQQDLIREEAYGKNYFYIGEIGDTPQSVLKLAPKAIIAALFRPFVWEATNPFILISSLENLIFLLLVLSIFFKHKIIFPIRVISSNALLLGFVIFTIFLAFGIGLSVANFGALVRYKTPLIVVFLSSLFVVEYLCKNKKEPSLSA